MRTRNRRGMLLLVVLVLLAMFAMLAVAFVVMAGAERSSAGKLQLIEASRDPFDKLLNDAAKVVATGQAISPAQANSPTFYPSSAITCQSLLEKIDGFDRIGTPDSSPIGTQGLSGMLLSLSQTSLVCNGQLIEFALPQYNPATDIYPAKTAVDPFHCVGCVLTMLDGPNAGLSTRIVGVDVNAKQSPPGYAWPPVQMVAFEGGVQPSAANNYLYGNHYIVNGFPYSGMGFGYNNTSGALTATALLPNAQPANWGGANGVIPGGVNSDYTAPDYQDPLTALAVSDGSGGVFVPIPSLHRSDLLAYQNAQNGNLFSSSGTATLLQVMFRPNWINNPNFTGSNISGTFTSGSQNFNPMWDGLPNGKNSWDVDNMGRGRPDSVWVDLGMPVRFAADGKAYKPLFAILCLDMDGRLNINAHGNLAQTIGTPSVPSGGSGYYTTPSLQSYQSLKNGSYQFDTGPYSALGMANAQTAYAGQVGGAPPNVTLPRGQGTGPAEVNLMPLFRNLSSPTNFSSQNYQYLLSGNNANGTMGRYGPLTGGAGINSLPGLSGTGSLLTINEAFPYSGMLNGTYWSMSGVYLDAYGTPPDPQAMGAFALDTAGRPLYISFGGQVSYGPYDLDTTRNAPHGVDLALVDNPFSVAEFESIMRWTDRDAATLPRRLVNLTNTGGGSILNGRCAEFTVESYNVPVSPAVLPPTLRFNSQNGQAYLLNRRSVHPIDLLYAQVVKNGGSVQQAQSAAAQLLPWEVLEGLKMDINRPFGAGAFSSTTNGSMIQGFSRPQAPAYIPDQPGTTGETMKQYVNATSGLTKTTFNYSADAGAVSNVNGAAVNDSLAARQLYARHLYVLALSLVDTQAVLTEMQGVNSAANYDDVARMLAQWAVNVVAYRDHNNIMIPFSYDIYPFGNTATNKNPGWAPDNTVQHTVWGCKRPELLITETLAFHDRRTQDLNTEYPDSRKPNRTAGQTKGGYTTDPPKTKDPSFNSAYRPQGSLFVELFNPWPLTEPRTPDLATPSLGPGVDLTKKTQAAGALPPSPIWRMIIVDPTKGQNSEQANGDELPDPDNPKAINPNFPVSPANPLARPTIERVVYFASLVGLNYPGTDGKVSYSPSPINPYSPNSVVVAPGGYAVVGSGDPNPSAQNRTYIGFESGKTAGNPSSTRMVTLNKGDITNPPNPANVNRVVQNTRDPAVSINAPVVLGIDSPQRLSISEPPRAAGYGGVPSYQQDGHGTAQTPSPATGKYTVPLDIPVDEQRFMFGSDVDRMFGALPLWSPNQGTLSVLNTDGTVFGYRIIYLQRLADPTRPYLGENLTGQANQPNCNPYRTVDAMTVDLTVFNGIDSTAPGAAKDPTTTTGNYQFQSHQRGEKNYLPGLPPPNPLNPIGEVNLWKQEPALKRLNPGLTMAGWFAVGTAFGGAAPTATMHFPQPLNQSLGHLNQPYGQPSTTLTGDPQYPFPLLNWAYRPFNNIYELMLVPTVSSSRLLARKVSAQVQQRGYYGYVDGSVRGSTDGNGGGYTPQAVYDGSNPTQVPYPHLLNFFESSKSSKPGASAQFHRLLYYLGVPSRFSNTQLQVRADIAGQAPSTPAHCFHTPYNRISRYREPGLINLNTVGSPDVLFGAMNAYFSPLAMQSQLNPVFWDKFVRSRRGDNTASGGVVTSSNPSLASTQQSLMNMLAINQNLPSRFGQPFRTPGGAYLTAPTEPAREINTTFLRGDPDQKVAERPLFETDDYLFGGTPNTLAFLPNTTPDKFGMACMDFNRGANFRYQLIQKLGSTASTHSNVFAIWITVGYFEALPAAVGPGNPDGYQLGQELGADTGDVTRHRAFYIFDRSLPVGFVRGVDINSDKAFLLKRIIE
jgi:hypothetical protein